VYGGTSDTLGYMHFFSRLLSRLKSQDFKLQASSGNPINSLAGGCDVLYVLICMDYYNTIFFEFEKVRHESQTMNMKYLAREGDVWGVQ
jgi:hypothetical protein